MTIFEIKQQLAKQLRGVFKKDPLAEHEETLNNLIEVQFSLRNIRKEKNGRLAKCELCGKRHGSTDDFCELIINDIEVNESAGNAKQVTLDQVIELMKIKDSIIFAIVLKGTAEHEIFYSELRGNFRKPKSISNFGDEHDDRREGISMA